MNQILQQKTLQSTLFNESKEELISIIIKLEAQHLEDETIIATLRKDLADRDEKLAKLTQEEINKSVNQPSSKQPEFNKNTGKDKKSKRKKKRGKGKGRVGAGNRIKLKPEVTNYNPLDICPECQADLTECSVTEKVSRIIEDIPPIPEKTIISEEIQERKWCSNCKKIVASRCEAALLGSDIGIRSLVLIAYFWVVAALSMPSIATFLRNFFRLGISTSGISKMMIRLANIMTPVADEILEDVKGGTVIFADETGWRVKGVLWWLWAFANKRTAYYWPDPKRGSVVVSKILGNIFAGVLVVDAWHAYNKIVCTKQTCMAHILRKIRKFRDMYPEYYAIIEFYKKLRRILDDGERLKQSRQTLGEERFWHRLTLLRNRLTLLLQWENPNNVLKEVIAKVARQAEYILTFVEYNEVPNHNNYAEYIIKKGILKRKISGGSMSAEGVRAYAVLQSIAQTCHLRHLSFTGFMTQSIIYYIRTGKPMSLSAYEAQITKITENISVTQNKEAA
jgi:transposase